MIQDKRFAKLLEQDKRFRPEAYSFVFEVLDYAQNRLHLGESCLSEPVNIAPEFESDDDDQDDVEQPEETGGEGKHITGQVLTEAARQYALEMYGFMAKAVLEGFGIKCTGDIGEIVYNMIKIGRMRKTPTDSRQDFENVYDFAAAFDIDYVITPRKK
ncbi:MAG: hypothetical protein FWD31_05170 [Planctomycetaceae bacterium]|nr:hypothetical protein [Planctomycetaceae bacterium]